MPNRTLPALLLAFLLLAPAAAEAQPWFAAKTDFGTGSYPYSLALADVNGDGVLDAITADAGAGTVSVLPGNGLGGFAARVTAPAGGTPTGLAVADVNGDGHPDLVVTNLYSATASVLLGNGTGGFLPRTTVTTGSQPFAVAIADLDGDGVPDLAITNSNGATVSVLHGHGDGTFGARVNHATGGTPRGVAAGDLNGDGIPDLAVASGAGVSVLFGTGGGAFAPRVDIATGSLPLGVAIGDANGDGHADLAVSNYGGNTVSLLPGLGAGTFGARRDVPTGANPFGVAIADLDGDGHADLVVTNSTAASVSVLAGDGTGAFAPRSDFTTGVGPFALAVRDLDADGRPDILTANYGAGSVSLLRGTLPPSFTALASAPNPSIIGGAVTLTATVAPASATGSVTFHDGAALLGSVPLAAGTATLVVSDMVAGDHVLTARYPGDAALAASVSPDVVQTVLPIDSTETLIVVEPSPSLVRQPVTLTAFVAPASASGLVTFLDGPDTLGTATLALGQAVLALPSLPAGTHALRARYEGDPLHYASTSDSVAHTVQAVGTRVALASSLEPSRFTQAVDFTAHVTDSLGGADVNEGSVQFVLDGSPAGAPVALAAGHATLTGIANLAAGAHAVQALYEGTASFRASAAETLQTVLPIDSTHVTLAATPSPSLVRQAVVLTATLVPASATGSVTFRDGADSLGTAPVVSGVATLPLPAQALGTHAFTAAYGGTPLYFYPSASETLAHAVEPVGTHVTLASSLEPSRFTQAVDFTAHVTDSLGGADVSEGSVQFVIDGSPAGAPVALAAGHAALTGIANLAAGAHAVQALYEGTASFRASAASTLQNVLPIDSTHVTLAATPSPSLVRQAVVLTATLVPAGATGRVTFRDGVDSLGSAAVTNGVATLPLPARALGTHAFHAAYGGAPLYFYPSASETLAHVVEPVGTHVAVATSTNPSRLGQPVAFRTLVTDSLAGAPVDSGTVRFTIDGSPVGEPVALADAGAVLAGVDSLGVGTHDVVVLYAGIPGFRAGVSDTLHHVVATPAPRILSVRDVPADQGGRVDVRWSASNLDAVFYDSVKSYWLLRAAPAPSAAGTRLSSLADPAFAPARGLRVTAPRPDGLLDVTWEVVDSLAATQSATYGLGAATASDSVAGSNPFTSFLVVARTAGGATSWTSAPDSGYSVDNLAPPAPAAFAGDFVSGTTTLHWSPVAAPDLAAYELHRGKVPGFAPDAGNLVATLADTSFVDASDDWWVYQLRAVDVHGNASAWVPLVPTGTLAVDVGAPLAFALDGARPNPARGNRMHVAFTLARAAAARLELLDVGGRRVLARDVGKLGPGHHVATLGAERRLAPGLYLLRLVQGADVRVARVAVLD